MSFPRSRWDAQEDAQFRGDLQEYRGGNLLPGSDVDTEQPEARVCLHTNTLGSHTQKAVGDLHFNILTHNYSSSFLLKRKLMY